MMDLDKELKRLHEKYGEQYGQPGGRDSLEDFIKGVQKQVGRKSYTSLNEIKRIYLKVLRDKELNDASFNS